MIKILKKDGEEQAFNGEKIKRAIRKSAERVCIELTDKEEKKVVDTVRRALQYNTVPVPVSTIHNMVECALDSVNPNVAKSYREYRDNKSAFASMLDKVYNKKLSLAFIGDRSNANADSALVTTQKAIVYNELNSELYKKFFLTRKEEREMSDGYIYIHDRGSRLDSVNCFSRDTKFITTDGVHSFYDFSDGDVISVYSHKGIIRKAVVKSYGVQELQTISFSDDNGVTIDIHATKNHRWILSDASITTDIKLGDVLIISPIDFGGKQWTVSKIEKNQSDVEQTVWCLEVEEDHSFILDGGIPTGNCCLFDMKSVLNDGFLMGNLDYVEPKTLDVAFDLIGDVTMNAAACQYGGFTISEIDKLLAPYAQKSYDMHIADYKKIVGDAYDENKADEYATNKVRREFEQGFQSWEMKFNSVASSRGDYPFTAITFGLGTGKFETMASSVCMKVRKEGQGKPGFKHPVLFPKINFFYDENLHGEGKELEWLFDEAIDCSSKSMYPDFISCTGDGYAANIYKKYGKTISKMGCIDFAETITVTPDPTDKRRIRDVYIGEFFNKISNGDSANYSQSSVSRALNNINDKYGKDKFSERGYMLYDGELLNNWAIRFKEENGRKPCRGDVFEYFGNKLPKKAQRLERGIDSKLFDLWDSYLELKVVDVLKKNGFQEVFDLNGNHTEKSFIRNKIWHRLNNETGKAVGKQIDIFFPALNIGFEVEDFTTHSKVDNEPLKFNQKGSMVKNGPSYFKDKQDFFKGFNIDVYEIWEDDIRNMDFSVLESVLGVKLSIDTSVSRPREQTKQRMSIQTSVCIDLIKNGITQYVKDIDDSFVRIQKIIKNYNVTDWLNIKLANGTELSVTSDHPFLVRGGQILAGELQVGNCLVLDTEDEVEIIDIVQTNDVKCSYDIQTESGTFVFSGVQSHNCRATLSPWYVRGGMEPADENDYPVYEGRFNMGAISLHFPMIVAKAKQENRDFYEVLDYYLEMVRRIHQRTFQYLSHKKAGTNPLGFCQGGFLNGYLNPDAEIGEDFLRPMTMSFGITALNEASILMNGKSIRQDNTFAIEVLKYINDYVNRIKKEDGILYAIYGTPAESLCHLQIEQFRKKYGIIKGVSDKEYTSNSFHCYVGEDITPVEKQNIEYPMFHLSNGGAIQYVRYRSQYNLESIKTLVRRAMKMGFYEGINFELDYCEKCGHSFIDSDTCPKCGSTEITRIERMNGYLGYSRVKGKTMYADHKLKEFEDRVSM